VKLGPGKAAAASFAAALACAAAGCERGQPAPADAPVAVPSGAAVAKAEAPAGLTERPGALLHEEIPGRWRRLRPERVDPALSPEQRELVGRLEAIGYAQGSTPAPARSGVTRHVRGRAFAGRNFLVSGHAPGALLMDMDGNVLHRWRYAFLDAFPDYPPQWLYEGAEFWRRAHLFENGDVLAIFEGLGLIKIDRDSKLLWASGLRAHHDLEVTPTGEIYVLTRRGHLLPRLDPDKPILEDSISVLGPDGEERRRVSLLEALERSAYRHLWQPDGRWFLGDLFHTNSLALLDGGAAGRLPAFRRGNLLVSMLVPDLIAVVDLEREEVVWAAKGSFRDQHDPRLLANGNLLLFDNRGAAPHSRVLELDPAQPERVVWDYTGSPERPFFSSTCGTAQRLPNGNTLVTESDGGRAFELTPEQEIAWEFVSPWRAGAAGELVATLFELVRLPPDFGASWAPAPAPGTAR
jgi:hypothetical protein